MCCVNEKLNEATVELDKNIKKKQSSSLWKAVQKIAAVCDVKDLWKGCVVSLEWENAGWWVPGIKATASKQKRELHCVSKKSSPFCFSQ